MQERYICPKSATLFSRTLTFLLSLDVALTFVENDGNEFFEMGKCMERVWWTRTVVIYLPLFSRVRTVFTTPSLVLLRLSRVTNSGKPPRKGLPIGMTLDML